MVPFAVGRRIEILAIVLVLILAAFSRLYRIGDYMTFLGDEGRDAIVVRDIVLGRHFPLIGPGTSVGSMYLGPLYYYLIAPSLFISDLSPVGPSVFVAILGIATVAMILYISKDWFGFIPAIAISTLYAISPVVIIYSRSSWNPNVMPFFALLTMFSVYKIWQSQNWRWLIVTAVSLAFVLNSHYLGLLLLPPVFFFILISKNLLPSKRLIIKSLAIFCFLMSPLLFFDIRHSWTNFTALKTFFTNRETTVNLKAYKAIPNIWPIWQDVNTSLLAGGQKQLGQIVSVALLAFSLVLLIKQLATKTIDPKFVFILVWLMSGLVGLGLYKQHIYAHYFGFIFPAPFFLLGYFFSASRKSNFVLKVLLAVLFLIILAAMIQSHPLRSSPNRQLFLTQRVSRYITEQSGGQPFNLALLAKSNYDAGYRYFFYLENSPYFTIHQKITDQLFVICELESRAACEPINNPLWEIASFGWAKIDVEWELAGGVRIFRLVHNPTGS